MVKAEIKIGEEPNSIAIRLICGASSLKFFEKSTVL
jgi:hypothetical protein